MSMNATDVVVRSSATFLATVDLPDPEPPAIPIIKGFSILIQSYDSGVPRHWPHATSFHRRSHRRIAGIGEYGDYCGAERHCRTDDSTDLVWHQLRRARPAPLLPTGRAARIATQQFWIGRCGA